VDPLTRRRFLTASGGALGLTAAMAAPATTADAASALGTGTGTGTGTGDRSDRSFTTQSSISNGSGGVQLSKGAMPPKGKVWEVQRVFWNVNSLGNVANDGVQTYLYRLPSSYTTAQAGAHMASSLDGWLGCCGNSGLTGNGDMSFDANDVIVRPGQFLWIWFIVPVMYDGYVMAAGMSVWEQPR
jgi:hypothetical protein